MLSRFRYRLAVFFAILGPGFITAVVDNDAGGIITYSQAGARWGYLPLWTLLPITIVLIMTQEMCSRMGAVTGKGLSDLIREEFGLRITFLHDGAAGAGEPGQHHGELRRNRRARSNCFTSTATSRSRSARPPSGCWW